MSKFYLGDVRVRTSNRKQGRLGQQPGAEVDRSNTTFDGKLPTSERNGGRATRSKPSRATRVLLAQRLQDIRQKKGLSQSDISGRMALRKAYISRVENAEHMPPLRILQRWARVLEVPLYQFFYDGKTPLEQLRLFQLQTTTEAAANGSQDRYLHKLRRVLARLSESHRKLLLEMAHTIHRRGSRRLSPRQRQVIRRAIAG